jgi:choline dehydrogenase-like flavoprotein
MVPAIELKNWKFAIVGSGASAFAAARGILDSVVGQVSIDVFDAGGHLRGRNQKRHKFPTKPKLWDGSDDPYDLVNGESIKYSSRALAMPTRYFGGLTRVWGGTFDSSSYFPKNVSGSGRGPFENIYCITREAISIDAEYGQRQVDDSIRIRTALESGLLGTHVIKTPKFLIGTLIDREDLITMEGAAITDSSPWFAGDALEGLQAKHRCSLKLQKGQLVTRMYQAEGGIALETQDGESETTIVYDKVFLAAGALGTAKLLVESKVVNSLTISDSRTIFGLAVNVGPKVSDTRDGYSRWWAKPVDPKADLYFQFYKGQGVLKTKILGGRGEVRWLPWWLIHKLLNRFIPYVAYFDSEASPCMEVSLSSEGAEFRFSKGEFSKKLIRQQLWRAAKKMMSTGLLIVPMMARYPEPLAGYHFGASLRMGVDTNMLGELPHLKNVHIVDSSILPAIEQGSITAAVMENAYRIALESASLNE